MTFSTADAHSEWVTQIVDEYQDRLIRYAQRFVGDVQAANDIVQDTFLKLCGEDADKLRPIVAQWLYRVCRNRALDVRKKERRMNHTNVAELERNATANKSGKSPEHDASVQDESAKALRALTFLPDNQQEVIRLRIEHGMSYRQISEITELSVSNVGYLLHTGLKTLRERLNQDAV
jgi:RNA polymerase sigma-70 factor (ECF subfamily)